MKDVVLNAVERERQHGKFKEKGYIMGVVYGDGIETTPVKFEEMPLRKTITSHGTHAKVWVNLNNEKKFGFIKEIQREILTQELHHVDIQVVAADHEIKMLIPIVYTGEDALKNQRLGLQVYKEEIEVLGKIADVPEELSIDISKLEHGSQILLTDLNLPESVKVLDESDTAYGVVSYLGGSHSSDDEIEEPDNEYREPELITKATSEE